MNILSRLKSLVLSMSPWWLVAAGLIGGIPWALDLLKAPAAFLVALVAFAAAVGVGAVTRPRERVVPQVPLSVSARALVTRAEAAALTLRQVSSGASDGSSVALSQVSLEADETLELVSQLAGTASRVEAAMGRLDVSATRVEVDRVRSELQGASPSLEVELNESLAALEGRLEAHVRLVETHKSASARLRTAVVRLEELSAVAVEISALDGSVSGEGRLKERLADVGDQLHGLREGLVEVEERSRRTLRS